MATLTPAQLGAYLNRINVSTPNGTNLETLFSLQWAHLKHIPFENLSLRLERAKNYPPSVKTDAAFEKLVTANRGGYCFEQNEIFSAALRALGFSVIDGGARVVPELPPDAPPLPPGALPLTPNDAHRITFVNIDGVFYLADVGFGGPGLPLPIQLPYDVYSYDISASGANTTESIRSHSWADALPLHRLHQFRVQPGLQGLKPASETNNILGDSSNHRKNEQHRKGYYLERYSKSQERWIQVYFFQVLEALPQDYEVLNYATCNLPSISPFLDNTVVARHSDEGRLTILNDAFRRFDGSGELVAEYKMKNEELFVVLKEHFGIEF